MIDIHETKKRVEKAKERVEEADISKRNKELILEYCNERQNGFYGKEVSNQRLLKLLSSCKNIAQDIKKDMDKLTDDDLKKYLTYLNEHETYSEWTRSDYKKVLKLWLKWLIDKKDLALNVDFFSAGVNKKKINKLKREDFLEIDDVKRLLDSTQNLRDKCIIYMMWDLGARVGELGSLRIKDVVFDNQGGATVYLKGKTGERSPYIIESVPTIKLWLSIHPDKNNPKAPLFVLLGKGSRDKEFMHYRTFYKVLEVAMERSGIKNKKFNPHLFRHSRALWAAQKGWNNQMANAFFGWTNQSNMFGYYIQLGSKDLKNYMKSMYGKEIEEEANKTDFAKCKCGALNDPKNDYCSQCGNLLNHKKALQEETIVTTKKDLKEMLDVLIEKRLKNIKA